MPLNVPQSNPLTPSQSEVKARIGSMKSLLELPFVQPKNIPKSKQVSTFDYLTDVLRGLGINTDLIFQQFFSQVLQQGGTFLEGAIISGLAAQLTSSEVVLPGQTFSDFDSPPNPVQVRQKNEDFIRQKFQSLGLTNFLQTAKQQIAKDLTLAIFGGQNTSAAQYLNPNEQERDRIIKNAVCASDAFVLSNNAFVRNEDLEYNRIALAQQLEKGEVIFDISCQKVKITLPEDPSWIFEGGGIETIESSSLTPAQSIELLATYVESNAQQINNEENSSSAEKTFYQILIEKFLSNIVNLVFPYMSILTNAIQSDVPPNVNMSSENMFAGTCSILNETSSSLASSKKVFGKTLVNQLYKLLLKLLLLAAIREFKKLTKNYFARLARERNKIKFEKMKAKFPLAGSLTDSFETAQRSIAYANALSKLSSITNIT